MSLRKAYLLIFIVLIVDQVSKIFVKTNFVLGEEVEVFSWFKILFIENEGMAWGTKIPGAYGKLFLTLFRLVAVGGIGYWLWDSVERKHSSNFLIVAIALILAGAVGNIIDSVFYGILFDESLGQTATIFTSESYGNLFHGKVVDMLYFPLLKGYFPEWIPFFGGNYFSFFDPVFNVADMAISTGVGLLLVFNKQVFPKSSTT